MRPYSTIVLFPYLKASGVQCGANITCQMFRGGIIITQHLCYIYQRVRLGLGDDEVLKAFGSGAVT